ncbi:MAG: amidohydrolase family protein, partial [Gemmatimonadetes bacterium]|nr:amidohydrolase family protein [Gemmatimonadota bacterium]
MNLGLHPHLARPLRRLLAGAALPLLLPLALTAQVVDRPPDRPDGEGEGPFERLVLRGATLIDGTGAPPIGPVDIVIENDRITDIRIVGYPGVPVRPEARPEPGTREIDLEGKYVLPGFIDMHTHQHTLQDGQAVPVNYVHKLWMAHGITTVRDVASFQSLDWLLETKDRSGRNEITAPRTEIMLLYGMGSEGLDMLSLFRPGGPFETE